MSESGGRSIERGFLGLTDTELRATPVPVSGPLTDTELRATDVPVKINSPLAAFGEMLSVAPHPLFQGSFEYTVDNTEITTNTVVNGGTVTQGSAMAVCTTSTTTASSALLVSKQQARYKAGSGGAMRFTSLFTTPVAATEQYIGLADEVGSSAAFKNGYMIGYDGTTFGFHRFQNDAKSTTALANWDDPLDGTGASGITIDQTKLNVFFIVYQFLGAGAQFIYMEKNETGAMHLVHTCPYAGANTTPSTFNPNYRFTIWADNLGTTDSLIVKSASYAYFVEGETNRIELHQPLQSTGNQQTTSITTELAIFTIRNKSTYVSKTNFIDIVLEGLSASIEASGANNLGTVRIVKNATLGGSPSYADINTSDSVVDIDTAGTTVTGGKELLGFNLAGKNDSVHADIVNHLIIVNPGETITVAGTSAASATIDAGMLWRELF